MAEQLNHEPRLAYLTVRLIARDPARGYVLLGGLGVLGVGEMWVKDTPQYLAAPRYDDAPIRSSEGGFGAD